ncbi:MAG: hypothetical protein E6J68_05425 [Deltaproteobacteria bacterium]|nr:MAG: hypothetical protein E6J68_05425 [Deltaproteobacteria bacterium]
MVVVLDVLVVVVGRVVVVGNEVVVGDTVVVVVLVGGAHGPKVPVTSAPLGGPLLVGVGQASAKSLLAFVVRVRLWTPSPGVALAGGPAPVLCGPVYGPYATQST